MRMITHKGKVPLYNDRILVKYESIASGRIVFTDTGGETGALYSTTDLVNWVETYTSPIAEETWSVYIPSRNRLYVVTNFNDDIWTDDGGLTYGTSSCDIAIAVEPFYMPSVDRMVIAGFYPSTINAYSEDGGDTFNYSTKPSAGYGRAAWSETLGIGVYLTQTGNLLTTIDGISWTSPVSSGVVTNNIGTLKWIEDLGMFIGTQGGGAYNGFVTSTDGLVWEQVLLSSSGIDFGSFYDFCWNPDLGLLMAWIWVNGVGPNRNTIITSPDAVNWSISYETYLGSEWYSFPNGCLYTPTLGFIGVNGKGYIIQTTDGINFATYSTPSATPSGVAIRDVNYCG